MDALFEHLNDPNYEYIPPTEEEIAARKRRHDYLHELGIYTALYIDCPFIWPKYPDGVHSYLKDESEARRLVYSDQELPQDLLDRLAYYKPIIDKQLEESKA